MSEYIIMFLLFTVISDTLIMPTRIVEVIINDERKYDQLRMQILNMNILMNY